MILLCRRNCQCLHPLRSKSLKRQKWAWASFLRRGANSTMESRQQSCRFDVHTGQPLLIHKQEPIETVNGFLLYCQLIWLYNAFNWGRKNKSFSISSTGIILFWTQSHTVYIIDLRPNKKTTLFRVDNNLAYNWVFCYIVMMQNIFGSKIITSFAFSLPPQNTFVKMLLCGTTFGLLRDFLSFWYIY